MKVQTKFYTTVLTYVDKTIIVLQHVI